MVVEQVTTLIGSPSSMQICQQGKKFATFTRVAGAAEVCSTILSVHWATMTMILLLLLWRCIRRGWDGRQSRW